jgi:hypothetical protein
VDLKRLRPKDLDALLAETGMYIVLGRVEGKEV